MKCPNCNKEVLPEWKTCPYCEFKPKLCSDPDCKSGWLPQQAHFCPKCGQKLDGRDTQHYVFNPRKTMSSLEDFQHGNIIVDGIILGRTPASELKKYGNDYSYYDYYSIMEGVHAYGEMSAEVYDRILEASEQNDPQLVTAMKDRVYDFSFYDCSNIPFLNELGLDKINLWEKEGENEMVEVLERNGYVRIEPPVIRKEWEEKILMRGEKIAYDTLYFISKEPNAYGNYIKLTCGKSSPISIGVSWLRDWKLYYS